MYVLSMVVYRVWLPALKYLKPGVHPTRAPSGLNEPGKKTESRTRSTIGAAGPMGPAENVGFR